ncbi:MAG: hypothetical protein NDJ72_07765 [Elusimicrobia bacterium]|nr:hypothetical protein [Elusimicrobiota bacterium]
MTRKIEEANRQRAVDGREILAALREGRLTRGQFDAWHALRRRRSVGFVITLREKAPVKRSVRKHPSR